MPLPPSNGSVKRQTACQLESLKLVLPKLKVKELTQQGQQDPMRQELLFSHTQIVLFVILPTQYCIEKKTNHQKQDFLWWLHPSANIP